MTRAWTIVLPYSCPPLSLNQRKHWANVATLKRQIKADTIICATAAKLPRGLRRVQITLHYQPATHRERDEDNMFATLKPAADGLTAYGLTADDSSRYVTTRCVVEPVGKPGRVWLTVEELEPIEVACVGGPIEPDLNGATR